MRELAKQIHVDGVMVEVDVDGIPICCPLCRAADTMEDPHTIVQELSRMYARTKVRCKDYYEEFGDYQQEINRLYNTIDDLEEMHEEAIEEIQKLGEQIERRSKELLETQQALCGLTHEHMDLTESYLKTKDEVEQLKEQIKEMRRKKRGKRKSKNLSEKIEPSF